MKYISHFSRVLRHHAVEAVMELDTHGTATAVLPQKSEASAAVDDRTSLGREDTAGMLPNESLAAVRVDDSGYDPFASDDDAAPREAERQDAAPCCCVVM